MSNFSHWDCRQGIITMQAQQLGKNPIVRLGDSISEEMWIGIPTNPDKFGNNNAHVLNAGFMGIKTAELDSYRDYVVGLVSPWCVLFQIGTNDTLISASFDINIWKTDFEDHINTLSQNTGISKIVVKSIPPVLNSTCGYDQARIDQMNLEIANICSLYPKSYFLNLDPYLKCSSTGYARPNTLVDSVHLNGGACWTVAWLEYCILNNQALSTPPSAC